MPAHQEVRPSQTVHTVRRTARSGLKFHYELFNCNNFNIRYWSLNYRGCWHQTCLSFFQAEDGIRDDLVTGVQTCALPIYTPSVEEGVVADEERVGSLAYNSREGRIDLAAGAGVEDLDLQSHGAGIRCHVSQRRLGIRCLGRIDE